MNDQKTLELLDNYLHDRLEDEDKLNLEKRLLSEAKLRAQLDILKFTQNGIKDIGLWKDIRAAHSTFMVKRKKENGPKVVPIFRKRWFQVAASLLLIFVFVSISLNQIQPSKIISDNYLEYRLPVLRSEEVDFTEGEVYFQQRNWEGLLEWVEKPEVTGQKPYFLAGVAAYEKAAYADALTFFERVEVMNASAEKPLFEQETDFYAALAHLQTGAYEEAIHLVNKMRDDPSHLYHDAFGNWDLFKIKVLKFKKND